MYTPGMEEQRSKPKEEIVHQSANFEVQEHTIFLNINGEKVGVAYMQYFSRPFPLYYIKLLKIKKEYRKQGHASKIMGFLEEMLRAKGKAGILEEFMEEVPQAKGMYERRGWTRLPSDKDTFVYNLPKHVNPSDIDFFETMGILQRAGIPTNHRKEKEWDS